MANWLVALRAVVLSLIATLSAISTSVAVWNLSLAEIAGLQTAYQVYSIVAGAIALGMIFAIGAAEITFDNAFTGRVWFECSWILFLFVLNTVGSVLVTVFVMPIMCVEPTLEIMLPESSCTSSKVLLACCWACTGVLVLYCILLATLCLMRRREPEILYCRISRLLLPQRPQIADNRPPQNVTPYVSRIPRQEAPKARSKSNAVLYAHRDGLGSEYEIEHYQPPSSRRSSQATPYAPPTTNIYPVGAHPFSAFYPQYLQAYQETEQQRLEGIAEDEPPPPPPPKRQRSKRKPPPAESDPVPPPPPPAATVRARPGGPRAPGARHANGLNV